MCPIITPSSIFGSIMCPATIITIALSPLLTEMKQFLDNICLYINTPPVPPLHTEMKQFLDNIFLHINTLPHVPPLHTEMKQFLDKMCVEKEVECAP